MKKKEPKYNIGWIARKSERDKLIYIMKVDRRISYSDALRNLVNERYSFLTSNTNIGINN